MKRTIPLQQRIPKSVRGLVAESLAGKIEVALNQPSDQGWWDLFIFPYLTLRQRTSPADQSMTNAAYIRKLIRANCLTLECNADQPPGYTRPIRTSEDAFAKRVMSKCADGDIRAALRLLTSDDTMSVDSADTLQVLQSKHPPGPENATLPPMSAERRIDSLRVEQDNVLAAVFSMQQGSGAGLDGMRPLHLQNMLGGETVESGRRLLSALTDLVNLILAGNVPSIACGALYGASLCALTKKDGGIRPIAVGSTFRRLSAKLAANYGSAFLSGTLRPKQLGVGTPGGCEAIVHAAREFASGSYDEPTILIKVDIRNAFNSIDRSAFLTEVMEKCPQIYPMMRQGYGFDSPIYYGANKLLSRTGLHQGDPLASLAFSVAINPIISSISSEFNVWYLDDGTFGGGVGQALEDLRTLEQSFASIGLHLNPMKSEVTVLGALSAPDYDLVVSSVRQVVPSIVETPLNTLSLLGSSLGVEGLNESLAQCSDKVNLMCHRVKNLDAHWALFFLTRYVSAPRVNYVLRTSPAYTKPSLLQSIDTIVRDALISCTNVEFSSDAWKQASLPLRFGGLGVRSVADLALPCYISSFKASLELMRDIYAGISAHSEPESITQAVSEFQSSFPQSVLPDGEAAKHQKAWDGIISSTHLEILVESANQVHRARLLAAKQPHSGAWLNVTPLPSLGLHLDDASVRVATALRVGAPICEPHVCRCSQRVDRLGHHGLSCRYSAGRLPRHANLNDVVKRALAVAGVPSWLEPVGLDRGDGRRPDGVTVFPYSRGKSLCWDATCVDSFSASSVVGSALDPGSAAAAAEVRKCGRYRGLTDRYLFQPVAIETTGVFGPSTLTFLRELGKRISARTGDKRETSWLLQRISLAVVRGNAAAVLVTGRLIPA